MDIVLLSLLGLGAAAALIIELFNDDDDTDTPAPPGVEEPTDTPTDGDDLLTGTDEADRIPAGAGDDTVNGLAGNDSLLGEAGDDALNGQEGDDSLDGGDGSDTLTGGPGDDVTFGRQGNDLQMGGDGDDALWGAQGEDLLIGDLGADTMIGGVGDDVLVGVVLEELSTESPDDDPTPVEGDPPMPPLESVLLGRDLDQGDTMSGGFGDDTLLIGNDDFATGGEGDDEFLIGDWITTDTPATIADFTAGEDIISIGYDDTLTETEVTVAPNDAGDAIISFNGQVLAIATGAGDSLTAEDIVLLAQDRTPDTDQTSAEGAQFIRGTEDDDTIGGGDGDDTINAAGGDDAIWGGTGEDTIFGREGNDILTGALHADRVFGAGGNDTVSGLWGNDWLRGGGDDDLIIDTRGADTIFGDGGNDTIIASGVFDEQAYMEILIDQPEGVDLPTPDFTADLDTGGDLINGGNGADEIYFGRNDTVTGGGGGDRFIGGDWIDEPGAIVTDFDSAEDVLVYSIAPGTTPALAVGYSDGATEDAGDAMLMVDGVEVMTIAGVGTGFTAANVQVVARA